LVNALLKEYTALMTILSGSFVWYGPRVEGGGVVRAVECEGAYEDSEYIDEAEVPAWWYGRLGLSYGRYEYEASSSAAVLTVGC
jgi:hypothetical protein